MKTFCKIVAALLVIGAAAAAVWLLLHRHAETEYIPLPLEDDGE